MALLEIRSLLKSFVRPDGTRHEVVNIREFDLDCAKEVALRGASGSGKTTLLHLIAGILQADSGVIRLDGQLMSVPNEGARDRLRAQAVGYVFQSFNLLPAYSCLENVLLAMTFGHGADRDRAQELLNRVGLADRINHRPRQLSSGQQQRVAVARALAGRPKLVLADEPTGNLDPANARDVLRLIREITRENGAALLLVSHDRDILAEFPQALDLAALDHAAAHESKEAAR